MTDNVDAEALYSKFSITHLSILFAAFAVVLHAALLLAVPPCAEAAITHRVPVDQNGRLCVTGEFGEMYDNGPHKGMDIAPFNAYANQAFNVYASAPGRVVVSMYSNSWGNYVKIEHGDGTHTLYAHLSSRSVSTGERVDQGQVLGVMGETGYAFGKHLHFEYYKNEVRVDPRLIITVPGYLVPITKSNSSSNTHTHVYGATKHAYKSYNTHTVTETCSCGSTRTRAEACTFTTKNGKRVCSRCGKEGQPYGSNKVVKSMTGAYFIGSARDGNFVLDVASGNAAPGANIQFYAANKTQAQQFVLVKNSNGTHGLLSRIGTAASTLVGVSGSNVQTASNARSNLANQWYVEKTPDGSYAFRNKFTNTYLDAEAGGAARSLQNIQVYAGNGTDAQKFSLTRLNLTKHADVTGVDDRRYTGAPITLSPTVKIGNAVLRLGSDYSIRYKNNTSVGVASVLITGKGNYTGTLEKTFRITATQTRNDSGGSGGSANVDENGVWKRLAGWGHFDTMVQVVGEGWKNGFGKTVVVATSNGYWDALSAAGIAGLNGSPVLITGRDALDHRTASELRRLRPSRVIVIGGPSAVSESAFAEIAAAAGVTPVRVFGQTMTDTAATANERFFAKRSSIAILATSHGFHDALSAAPVSYAKHYPIFLVENRNVISDHTISAMKECGIKQVIVAGGASVISDALLAELSRYGITLKKRLSGWDYYDTSREIALWAIRNGMSASRMGVATSYDYYDALCGAALCGKNKSVLVLADARNAENVDSGSTSFTKKYKSKISRGYVFGGTSVVSTTTFDKLIASTR